MKTYSAHDVKFMTSLDGAIHGKNPIKTTWLLYIIAALILTCLTWANFAQIDEITRGFGRVIPSYKIQVIQNLEGGILKKILINEGDPVKKGQVLVIIDDTGAGSHFEENNIRLMGLKARKERLKAEVNGNIFSINGAMDKNIENIFKEEKKLFIANQKKLSTETKILKQQLRQKEIGFEKASQNIQKLKLSQKMIQRELELTKPLFQKKLVSELEYLQIKQRLIKNEQELLSEKNGVSLARSQIMETQNQIQDIKAAFTQSAQANLSNVVEEIERLEQSQVALEDRVERTHVRSPVNGTVKQLLINTEGGVISPGMDILEIVPMDDKLLVEAKIKPSDIAFLYPGQDVVIKVTAYDFSIYGSLSGKLVHISADTIMDAAQHQEFYLVNIKTDKNYLGMENDRKDIIVGMTVQADIITGKKSILQYLMKPILRAKYNAFKEK